MKHWVIPTQTVSRRKPMWQKNTNFCHTYNYYA